MHFLPDSTLSSQQIPWCSAWSEGAQTWRPKIQSLTNELNNKPEAVQSMRFDSGQFVGFGFGMLLMGFVISGVVIFVMNKRNIKSFDLTAQNETNDQS